MKHIRSTALAAGAQENCVDSEENSLHGMGSIAQQPAFRPVSRRAIMSAVNTCGRDLGLRHGTLVVLDALLSCLPCQGPDGSELPVAPTTLLTVYASNDTLCFRAKGLTDRQLRRHLDVLEQAGLIQRRDSSNGKRFPVMKGGKVIGAFGLDLSPLFAQADDLLAHALKCREQAEELRGLRARILHLRAACVELHLDSAAAAFIDGLRNLVRRATLTLVEARGALARLSAVIASNTIRTPLTAPDDDSNSVAARTELDAKYLHENAHHIAAETPAAPMQRSVTPAQNHLASPQNTAGSLARTDETSVSDGQNVRHIEPESDTKKRKPVPACKPRWIDLTEVSTFYQEPQSAQQTAVIAFEMGKMLRISQELLASAVTKLGLWELLRVEDQIARKIDAIQNPDAYLRSILRA